MSAGAPAPALTTLPSVISARDTRPATGAVTTTVAGETLSILPGSPGLITAAIGNKTGAAPAPVQLSLL